MHKNCQVIATTINGFVSIFISCKMFPAKLGTDLTNFLAGRTEAGAYSYIWVLDKCASKINAAESEKSIEKNYF